MDTLLKLTSANAARCPKFGFGIKDWIPEQWSNAAAGEMGELCNLIKKGYSRGDSIMMSDIAKEVGDVVIYLDILCQRLNISLTDCIRIAFNETSKKRGYPDRI